MASNTGHKESQHWKAYYCPGCDDTYAALLPGCPCCEGSSVDVAVCPFCGSRDMERRPELDVVNVRDE